jgi:putative ABC transport system permease protein
MRRRAQIVKLRLRSLWRRNRVEQELDDELRFHYDTLVEKYIGLGLTQPEARRRAFIEMGGVDAIKDDCRDARGWSLLENIGRDTRYALRGLRRNPLFTFTAVAAIAMGIGVNTAVFSMIYSVMYRPLPVSHPETIRNVHIATFGEGRRAQYGTPYFVSWAEFNHIRSSSKTAEIAGLAEVTLSRRDDARDVHAQLASDNLLPMLGGRPLLGRFFLPDETSSPGTAAVVVLSYRAWQDWFGGAADVVGQSVVFNRTRFTVIGVADDKTNGPVSLIPDVWIPLTMQELTRPGEVLIDKPWNAWIQVIARRKAGFTDDALTAEMQVLAQQSLLPHLPKRRAQVTVAPGALFNFPRAREVGAPVIAILYLAVTLVLIVACANVANMLLARGLSRRREIAVRLSIGAGRRRLLQQLLTESILLAGIGGIAGLMLAWFCARGVMAMIPADMIGPTQFDFSPDSSIVLYTLAVSILTGLVFGLLPALNALRFNLTPSLRSEGLEESGKRGRRRLQNTLIGVQVAVCLVLLVNAGLLLRGLRSALQSDVGQTTHNVLTGSFDLRQQQYTPERATRFVNTLRDNMSVVPGIRAASMTFVELLHEQCGRMAWIVATDGSTGPGFPVACDEIGPDFFRTMDIHMLYGREFSRIEMLNTDPVAILDERLAQAHFGSPQAAIGRFIREDEKGANLQIVGVAAATRTLDVTGRGLSKVYTPMRGIRNVEAKIVLSYAGPSAPVEKEFRNAAAALDGSVRVRVRRIEDSVNSALIPARMAATAAVFLGALALLLACTGIYGVVAFAVTRRRREVGIRVALGATRRDVLNLIVWQGMKPVAVGCIFGMVIAGAGAQLIRAMLYGVSPFDPVSFLATAAVLTLVAALASLIPARAALGVDPGVTLRHD